MIPYFMFTYNENELAICKHQSLVINWISACLSDRHTRGLLFKVTSIISIYSEHSVKQTPTITEKSIFKQITCLLMVIKIRILKISRKKGCWLKNV